MKIGALARCLLLLGFGTAALAAPAQADEDEKPDDLWARLPRHVHSARELRDAHAHSAHHSAAEIPQYALHASLGYKTYSGPFPLQRETHASAKLTVHSAARGQFALQLDRDDELGRIDRSAGASFRVPLTAKLSLSGTAKFSVDRAVNPAHQFTVAPSYTLFYIPQGKMYGAVSVSAQLSRYRTSDAYTIDPMLTFGSLAAGVMLSIGYTFGQLYNAQPSATILSLGQSTITTGPSVSFNWTVNPQLIVAVTVMPNNKTVTLFSTSTETTARASASYQFRNGPRLGFAVEHMHTSSSLGFLNRSLQVETSLTVSF